MAAPPSPISPPNSTSPTAQFAIALPAYKKTTAQNHGWVNPQAVGYTLPANIQIAVEPPERIREVAMQLVDLPEAASLR